MERCFLSVTDTSLDPVQAPHVSSSLPLSPPDIPDLNEIYTLISEHTQPPH